MSYKYLFKFVFITTEISLFQLQIVLVRFFFFSENYFPNGDENLLENYTSF
jgi:hypothetical protein